MAMIRRHPAPRPTIEVLDEHGATLADIPADARGISFEEWRNRRLFSGTPEPVVSAPVPAKPVFGKRRP